MITSPSDPPGSGASAWISGIAGLFLAVGAFGAVQPLKQALPAPAPMPTPESEVITEEFEPPPPPGQAAEPDVPETEATEMPAMEEEIPPLPEIVEPLTPPEVEEFIAVDPPPERPRTKPVVTPAPRLPAKPPSTPLRREAAPGATTGTGLPGGQAGGSAVAARPGGGKGRFPQPVYPAAARRDRLQGTVTLAITVEASGLPAAVSVIGSSGHAALDSAARDGVQRRWRWPSGELRKFTVPIRFVLK